MPNPIRSSVLLTLAILAVLGCSPRRTPDPSPQQPASSTPISPAVANPVSGPADFDKSGSIDSLLDSDTLEVARAAGQDYGRLVAGALRKDPRSLHTLFDLAAHAGFDGASSEGNAAVLGALLKRLGDKSFSECLAREPQDIREAVRQDLEYDMGLDGVGISSPEYAAFRNAFPLTFAACYTVEERVRDFVLSCRREVHGCRPDEEIYRIGVAAVPGLLKLMSDHRKVWVRIGPPEGGPESRFIDVAYLYADDEGPRNSVAEFALLCICEIREPESGHNEDFTAVWNPVLHEFADYDGNVSPETVAEIKLWYDRVVPPPNH